MQVVFKNKAHSVWGVVQVASSLTPAPLEQQRDGAVSGVTLQLLKANSFRSS